MYFFFFDIINVIMLLFSVVVVLFIFFSQKLLSFYENDPIDVINPEIHSDSESSDNDNQKTENIRINTFRNSITYRNLKSVNNYKSTNNKKRRKQRVSFVDNDVIEVKEFFAY